MTPSVRVSLAGDDHCAWPGLPAQGRSGADAFPATILPLLTVDGIDDLGIGESRATLLDLCVVEIEELIEPRQELGPGLSCHGVL